MEKTYLNKAEQTLGIIKFDAVLRGVWGGIFKRILSTGLKVVAMKMVVLTREQAEAHYQNLIDRPAIFDFVVKVMTMGPVILFVVEGIHAVEGLREIVGDTEPLCADPGTIRDKYATTSKAFANDPETLPPSVDNVVHCSDSIKSAKKEIVRFFSPEEIFLFPNSYELVQEHMSKLVTTSK